jgi:hypothetical protein
MAPRSPGFIPELLWKAVEKNFRRLMQEIRETGELSVLLTRAARGQALTAEEKKRMRAQLIDVAKAIPALAIFAAPGGLLLLILLAKVLPFSLLPSAFQEQEEETGAGEAKDAASSAAGRDEGEGKAAEVKASSQSGRTDPGGEGGSGAA